MWSIVAREVNFGMAVAFMISVEQRAIKTVVSADISHSDICLNTWLVAFCSINYVFLSISCFCLS